MLNFASMTDSSATSPINDLWPYFRPVFEVTQSIDWTQVFGNSNPVELDIGCGRGMFLFNASGNHPQINYAGMELDFKEGRRAARRLFKQQRPNAIVYGGDARDLLGKHIVPHSVAAAHVYFPDPWWKRSHKRRRLFTDQFAAMLARVVMPGGLVHSWTDVGDYFEVIAALMDQHELFETLERPQEREAAHDLDYQTSFERRKRQEGCTIHRGLWRRKPLT